MNKKIFALALVISASQTNLNADSSWSKPWTWSFFRPDTWSKDSSTTIGSFWSAFNWFKGAPELPSNVNNVVKGTQKWFTRTQPAGAAASLADREAEAIGKVDGANKGLDVATKDLAEIRRLQEWSKKSFFSRLSTFPTLFGLMSAYMGYVDLFKAHKKSDSVEKYFGLGKVGCGLVLSVYSLYNSLAPSRS